MPHTLAKLMAVRSQQVEEVLNYLDRFAQRMGELPPYYPPGFAFDQIRQKVSVSQQRLRYDPQDAARREAERRAGVFADDEAREKAQAYQWRGAEMFEREGEPPTVLDWDNARTRLQRGVILGDPGFGKSWLLKYEGRTVAREQAAALRAGKQSADETILPIHLRLGTLATALKGRTTALNAMIQHLKVEYGLSDRMVGWTERQLAGPHSLILLDALDEVPVKRRQKLIASLSQFARNAACRILLTTRIVGYQGPPFPLQDNDQEREMELVAFDPEQVDGFIAAWFALKPEARQRVQNALRQQPALRGAARIPLLLSFICRLGSRRTPLPSRRTELYDAVLRMLLEGSWRDGEMEEQDDVYQDDACIERKLETLADVAWHFATEQGDWQDLMPTGALDKVLQKAARQHRLAAQTKEGTLYELSVRDGVLVKAGDPEGGPRTQVPYLFLHRTFHEYLVARYLSCLDEDELLAHARQHWWFDADWAEVIPLLAGCLDDPLPLLEAIRNEPDDAFHEMRLLAGRCLAETRDRAVSDSVAAAIVQNVRALLGSASNRDKARSSRTLVQMGAWPVPALLAALRDDPAEDARMWAANALGQIGDGRAVEALLAALRDPEARVRRLAAEALGQIGDAGAVDGLLAALHSDPAENGRRWAVGALGKISDARAVDALLAALRDDPAEDARMWAANALGQIGDARAVDALLAALHSDPAEDVRGRAAEELGEIGDARAVDALLAALHNDPAENVRRWAVGALAKIGDARAVEGLLAALRNDPAEDVRWRAAFALGEIGDAGAVDGLLAALHNDPAENVRRCWAVVGALGKIGDARAVDALLAALHNDPAEDVRERAAEELGEIGDARAVDALLAALHSDPAEDVRGRAAEELGEIGDARAVDALLAALHSDPAEDVRGRAAEELGKIGDARAVDALLAALHNDPAENVRRWAVGALAKIGDARAVEGLLAALRNDPAEDVRWRAAFALGEIGDAGAVDGLLAALHNDPAENVRGCWAVVGALGEIGDARAVDGLLAALHNDPAEDVRRWAVGALGKIGDARAVDALLAALHNDPAEDVRERAAEELGEIGDARAVDGLLAALHNDPDEDVRWQATDALGEIGGPRVQAVCDHLLDHWPASPNLVLIYELLLKFAPSLRAESGDAWPAWRQRLMPPTRAMLKE